MLYFSYGSNMSSKRLQARTPSARFVTVASLSHHDLRFHKRSRDGSSKCDAFETGDVSHSIIGVVFEIADAEKPILDRYEGLGHGYEKKVVRVSDSHGDSLESYTYYANDIDPALAPYHWYHHHVLTGAIEHGLPTEYVSRIECILTMDDPDAERHAREMAVYEALRTEP